MPHVCALAGIDDSALTELEAVLRASGQRRKAVTCELDVRALDRIRPNVLIGDLDHVDADPLELLRQIRFVLPACMIAIYSDQTRKTWSLACHTAGANAMLAKTSTEAELTNGLTEALASGCYTDPRFDT